MRAAATMTTPIPAIKIKLGKSGSTAGEFFDWRSWYIATNHQKTQKKSIKNHNSNLLKGLREGLEKVSKVHVFSLLLCWTEPEDGWLWLKVTWRKARERAFRLVANGGWKSDTVKMRDRMGNLKYRSRSSCSWTISSHKSCCRRLGVGNCASKNKVRNLTQNLRRWIESVWARVSIVLSWEHPLRYLSVHLSSLATRFGFVTLVRHKCAPQLSR